MHCWKIKFLLFISCWLFLARLSSALEMHFEQKDGGFFIRPQFKSGAITTGSNSGETTDADRDLELDRDGDPATLKTERFTVLPSSQPVAIRVLYGPFSTKQTVPIRLLVPDPLDTFLANGSSGSMESEMIPPLDLSAHLVTPVIAKDTPILRVLFHAGQTAFGLALPPQANQRNNPRQQSGSNGRRQRTRLCLVAQASKSSGDTVSSSCSPDTRDSTCLAELTLPIHWWPDTPMINEYNPSEAPIKPTKIPIQVSYAVYEPENGHCNEIGLSTTYGYGIVGEGSGTKRIQIQPPTPLATVILTGPQKSFRIVKADASDAVKLLVPQGALYPHAKFYIPVNVGKHDHHFIVAFIMKARVKSGLRIIGIEQDVEKTWNITTDFNPRRTLATITAVRKFDPRFQETKGDEEVFNWILEAAEEAGNDWDGGRVVWILRYVIQPSADMGWMKKDPFSNFRDERHKLTTRLEIQKDDIQAVLPIAKSWEVVNTAVLDGKQVSRPMKIFTVSRAGKVADETLQASCRSLDESVLKVSSSCTSVYVDGSEIRGSTNATIVIKYGSYEGSAQFIVWMPEPSIQIQLSDSILNQIKGWKVPNDLRSEGQGKRDISSYTKGIPAQVLPQGDGNFNYDDGGNSNGRLYEFSPTAGVGDFDVHRTQRQVWDEQEAEEQIGGTDADDFDMEDKSHCRLLYQHSRIDVFARFLASDHDSGRTSYFISKKTYLKVTDLISDYLRVADTQVAIIKPITRTIQGLSPGRTEIQVVSPVTGRVLGSEEIRVVNEKVSVTSMKVDVISGVQLSLFPDTDSDSEFVAETTVTSKLSAKYQEALLDIKLRFSDNTWIKLDETEPENHDLAVDSLDRAVVELPTIQNSKYPRILAVSEGGGPIMRVSLELSDQCHRPNSIPLAMAVAHVEVNFTTSSSRSEFTQNDSNQGLGMSKHSFRQPRRGNKERLLNQQNGSMKKDLSSLRVPINANDVPQIPLKDDSNRASRPSARGMDGIQVGFGPDKGWTLSPHNKPLQIAMYVLLGVFSVAILVFVASCVVYASRVKKRELSHPDSLGLGIKFEHGARTGATTNAHDWVWLGRASMALHPSLDSSKQSSKSVSFESNANANGNGNTGPIRIIANPSFESSRQQTPSQQSLALTPAGAAMSGGSPSPSSLVALPASPHLFGRPEPPKLLAPPPPRPPKPQTLNQNHSLQQSHSPAPSIDSTTFSVKSGGGSTPKSTQLNNVSSVRDSNTNGGDGTTEYRPPIPPHRNLSPTTVPNSTSPPRTSTKSHHQSNYSHNNNKSNTNNNNPNNNNIKCGRGDPDDLPNPSLVEYEPPTRRNERTNIVGNPMCFIDEEDEDEDDEDELRITKPLTVATGAAARLNHKVKTKNSDNVKLNMDYDQLMEYFDNLKETEA